jgi:hypothetical protein
MERSGRGRPAGSVDPNRAIPGFLYGDNGDSFKSFPKRWGAGLRNRRFWIVSWRSSVKSSEGAGSSRSVLRSCDGRGEWAA